MKRSLFPLLLILALATLESNRIFAMRAEYEKNCDVSARAQVIPPVVFEVTNKSNVSLRFVYIKAETKAATSLDLARKQTLTIDDVEFAYDKPSPITIIPKRQIFRDSLLKIGACLSHKINTTYPYTHVEFHVSESGYAHGRKQDSMTGRLNDLRHIRVIIKENMNSCLPIRLERLYIY